MKKILVLSVACAALMTGACDHYSTKLAAMDDAPNTPPNIQSSTQQVQTASGQSSYGQSSYGQSSYGQSSYGQSSYSQASDVSQIAPAAGGLAMSATLIGGKTFGQYLKSEYVQLAKYEQEQAQDYRAAKYYTDKIEKLETGSMVMPASFRQFNVDATQKEEIEAARKTLINALKKYRFPQNRYHLAMAQSRFDCWMDQAEESHKNSNSKTCRREFEQAMASLSVPQEAGAQFIVPLQASGTSLSNESRISLAKALNKWRDDTNDQAGHGFKMELAPSGLVSQEEATRQITRVRSIMESNGIAPTDIVIGEAAQNSRAFKILIKKSDNIAEPEAPIISVPVI